MDNQIAISLTVNGSAYSCDVAPHVTLLDFLRDELGLKGAKECCAVGECGACTLKVDGQTINSCLFLAVEADGCQIETIEGLAGADALTQVQDAFLKCGAVQCGFCIPGMVMSAENLMAQNSSPSDCEVREALSGNLCRCGGYNRMFDAIKLAAGMDTGLQIQTQHARTGNSIGSNAVRAGGAERVTGRQEFLADIELDGMVHLKLVTLDAARARIKDIDTTAARAVPGVLDIMTATDLPHPMPRFGPVFKDRPIIADGETQYHGEPVAVIAAETKDIAAYAATLVKVDYDILPAATDFASALAPDAPLVQPHSGEDGQPSNILKTRDYGWGDVDSVNAALVIENRYSFPMVTHFAIEPHGFIVSAKPNGMTIWSPVQHPYLLQKTMAELFDQPLSAVRVLAPDPGGGFGGKQNPKYEPLVAYMSLRLGRPCRLVLTLEETFQAVRRAAADVHIRTGFAEDGEILFQDIKSDYLIGAYVDIAERVMTKGNYLACGPYRVRNARIHARAVLSHTTPSTAFRGFGTPQVNWAVESQINAGARALGIDGLQIRLRNLARKGDEVVKGDFPADGDWPASVKMAADMVGWSDPLPQGRGRGIAVGIKSGATTGLSNSTVRLLADGSVIVYAGTSDMGQGARTIFAQIAADALGAPLDRVSVVMGDTSVVPFDQQTSASRSTVFMGTALTRACEDIQRQVAELACETTGVAAGDVTCTAGVIAIAGERQSIFDYVQRNLGKWNGELVGTGRMRKPTNPDHALGGTPAFFEFNCTAFEVEVDRDTGEILIHKHVTVGDVGKALNPLQVEMQDEGAAIMGLGHTIMEQIIMDDQGRIKNLGAIDYRIVTTKDMPMSLETGMIENADGPGPYGAKGVSEGAILCTAPALSAAVAQATGVMLRDLPLTPERIWDALQTA